MLEFYRGRGPRWQTGINDTLRRAMRREAARDRRDDRAEAKEQARDKRNMKKLGRSDARALAVLLRSRRDKGL